jgi:hypothetical protein
VSTAREHLDLIDAVVYGDAFDCAVTLGEVWRYSLVRVTPKEMRERLAEPALRELVAEQEGLYCLAGREELVERRVARRRRAAALRQRATRVARWLQYAPFVRGILLTGSVAADDAGDEADVDVLVVIAPGRLGLAFLLLGSVSRVVSRQLFCPNYYLSEAHLTLSRRDHYVAREVAQTAALAGQVDLLAANRWVLDRLPNVVPFPATVRMGTLGRGLQQLMELLFRGRLGDRCERRARRVVLDRLAAHHRRFGEEVPDAVRERFEAGVELRFHGGPFVDRSAERYEQRRTELARRMGTRAAR